MMGQPTERELLVDGVALFESVLTRGCAPENIADTIRQWQRYALALLYPPRPQ
jgi:hypothetical protein